jgi:hypothetical protein
MKVFQKIGTFFQRVAVGVGFAAILAYSVVLLMLVLALVGMFFGGAADWIAKDFGPFLKRYGIGVDSVRLAVLGVVVVAAAAIGATIGRDMLKKKQAEEKRAEISATLARGGSVSADAFQAGYATPSYRKYWIMGLSLVALYLAYSGAHQCIDYYKRFNQADRSATAHVVESDPGEAGDGDDAGREPSSRYEFQVDGKTYDGSTEDELPEGKQIAIRYNSTDPSFNHAQGDAADWRGQIGKHVFFLVIVLAILVGVVRTKASDFT